jgi:hypothetical protein
MGERGLEQKMRDRGGEEKREEAGFQPQFCSVLAEL